MFSNRPLALVSSLPNFTLHEICCVQNKFSVAPCICSLLLKCSVFSSFYALMWVSLWFWNMCACMTASSTPITVNSESGFDYAGSGNSCTEVYCSVQRRPTLWCWKGIFCKWRQERNLEEGFLILFWSDWMQ